MIYKQRWTIFFTWGLDGCFQNDCESDSLMIKKSHISETVT